MLAWKVELGCVLRGVVSLSTSTTFAGAACGFLASNTTALSGIVPACTPFATNLADVTLFLRAHKQHTNNTAATPIAAPKIENAITYPYFSFPSECPLPPSSTLLLPDDDTTLLDNARLNTLLVFTLFVKFH